jgi:WD40 repeat protein
MLGRIRSEIALGWLVVLALATALRADETADLRLVRRWGGDECYVGDRPRSLKFSSDSRQLAWCMEHGAAALYDLERQIVVQSWPKSARLVAVNLLTDPDEALLVFGPEAKCRGEIWNLRKHEKLRDIANWNGRFVLSDDRRFLATEHESLWEVRDLSTGKTAGSLPTLKMNRRSVGAIAVSPGGRRLGFWTHDNLAVWDFETGKNVWQITRPGPSVTHISFSSDGETMAVSRHENIELWRTDRDSLKCAIACFYPHGSGFLQDNERLWIAGARRALLAEVKSGKKLLDVEILKPALPGAAPFATLMAAASPDGKRLALANQDRVWLWDLETLQPLEPFREGRRGVGMAAAFSRHGDRVICSDEINGWVEREPKENRIDRHHDGSTPVTAIAVSRTDGTVIVGRQNTLEWWPAEAMKPVATRFVTKATQLRFTNDGAELYGLSQSRPFVYDARTGDPRPAPATIGFAMAIGRDAEGRWITARPKESELQIMIDNKYACVPFEPGGLFGPIVFPDGRTVAAAGAAGMILWNVATCEERRRLPCRLGNPGLTPVYTVSADGSRLAAWNAEHIIQVWNTQTGDEITSLRGHRAPITALDISPDRRQLVSGSLDGSVCLWDIGPQPTP